MEAVCENHSGSHRQSSQLHLELDLSTMCIKFFSFYLDNQNVSNDGQLLATEDLNPREQQIFFRSTGEHARYVKFHHMHIPISLNKQNQSGSRQSNKKVKAYAKNVYQESMTHYHEDNQNADTKRLEGHAKLITDQNIFVTNESSKSIRYFEKDLQSLTSVLPTSKSRISKKTNWLDFWLNVHCI
jgi:hypothetical protein